MILLYKRKDLDKIDEKMRENQKRNHKKLRVIVVRKKKMSFGFVKVEKHSS